jgi:membrane fusion protein, heavy metal efflux system
MTYVKLTAAVLVATTLGCRSEPPPAPAPSPDGSAKTGPRTLKLDPALSSSERVATVVAERRAVAGQLKLPGEVRASLGAAEVGALVGGRIASVLALEGARVERGQVLAWLDAPEVARATADVLRARARATSAKNKLARQLELDSQRATSRSALEDARTEAEVTRADLLAARTLLRSLGGNEPSLDDESAASSISARVALRAPVSGTVVRRDAVLGAAVTPEKTLFWLSGESPSFVVARVPEGAGPPADGEQARLQARGSSSTCKATVRGNPGVVDRESRTVDVRLEPEVGCIGLVPGGYVDVLLARAGAGAEGIVVPSESVVDVHGASVAFVAGTTPGEFLLRPVRVRESAGPEVLLDSGVQAGERVVSRGALLLKGELLRAELTGEGP